MGRHKQDDRIRCYRRRCNRLTSQRCRLRNVSSYLFRLSLPIKNGRRVTEQEAVREQDREQLALVSGGQEKERESIRMKRWIGETLYRISLSDFLITVLLRRTTLFKFWSFTTGSRGVMLKDD